MIYAAIDTETTGLGERCALLELAIVLEDTSKSPLPPVEDLPYFSSLVDVSEGAWWELFPIGMHQKNGLLAELSDPRKTGLRGFGEVDEAAASWLREVAGATKPRSVTPAGKNFARPSRPGAFGGKPGGKPFKPAGKRFAAKPGAAR